MLFIAEGRELRLPVLWVFGLNRLGIEPESIVLLADLLSTRIIFLVNLRQK